MINKICIIGVGLIGGSLAKALKISKKVQKVVGYSRSEKNLKKAQQLKVIDEYSLDIAIAIKDADIVIIATPVNSFKTIFKLIKPHLTKNMILSDVGSTKYSILNDAKEVFGEIPNNFIAAHPIAGKEKSSVEESEAALFNKKRVILTPFENSNKKSLQIIRDMWLATGAIIEEMDYIEHDKILAIASHLPHILAYALIDDYIENSPQAFKYTAGGFKDFSRIASSDAIMWRDICLANGDKIIEQVEQYKRSLDKLVILIKNKDSQQLENTFLRAKAQRDDHFKDK